MRYVIIPIIALIFLWWIYSTIKDIINTRAYMKKEYINIPEFINNLVLFNSIKISSMFLIILIGLLSISIILFIILQLSLNYW